MRRSKPSTETTGDLLAPKAAADFLGLSLPRLHRLRQTGEIPAVRVGWRKWRFSQKALMAYVEQAAGGSPATPSPPAESKHPIAALIEELPPPPGSDEGDDFRANATPIVRLANAILSHSIDVGCSDIHVEPDRRNVRVRCRIDGRMTELMVMPKHIQRPLLNRYKVMADLNPFDARPATGTIRIKHNNRDYNVRVSTLPSDPYGETLAMRVLDLAMPKRPAEDLGITSELLAKLIDLSMLPSGLILIAGPPGAGKTTTACRVLWGLNSIDRKQYTIEETREYNLDGITQCYTDARRGVDRVELVEAALKQKPDLVFVGDLDDDAATMKAVRECAAGTLTLATINARDSADALRRLIDDRGMSRSEAAMTVRGVLTQHLAGRKCPDCGGEPGKDCETCKNRGVKGRAGIFELLTVNWEIEERLRRKATIIGWYDAARENGMVPLRDEARRWVREGIITESEFVRTLGAREWYNPY